MYFVTDTSLIVRVCQSVCLLQGRESQIICKLFDLLNMVSVI